RPRHGALQHPVRPAHPRAAGPVRARARHRRPRAPPRDAARELRGRRGGGVPRRRRLRARRDAARPRPEPPRPRGSPPRGAAPLALPTDRPRPAVQTFHGDMTMFDLDDELVEALRALSREEGVTLFTTMMGALSVLIARWAGQDEVVIGTATSGRKRAATRSI